MSDPAPRRLDGSAIAVGPAGLARFAPALVVAAVAVAFLVATYRLPVAARAMPSIAGWVTLALVALDLASRAPTRWGEGLMRALNPSGLPAAETDEQETAPSFRTILAGIALVLTLIGSFLLLGVLPAAALTIFGALTFGHPREWPRNAVVAGAATLGIWLLFALVLRLQLFPGVLLGGTL